MKKDYKKVLYGSHAINFALFCLVKKDSNNVLSYIFKQNIIDLRTSPLKYAGLISSSYMVKP
jgi:hypothetical protein